MPPSALLAASITIVYKNDLNLHQSSKHVAGMSTGGVRPRGSLVQEATTKEGPRGALDNVGMVRSRGSHAEFEDRPRGSPNLRDSIVGLREAHGRHILEDGPRGSLEKNGLNPWRFAFLAGTRHRQYEVNTVKFDHMSLQQRLRSGRRLQSVLVRNLPPAPKSHREVEKHPLGWLFKEAERDHLKSHNPSGSWTTVPIGKAKGKQILNCMWVYIYKQDKKGRLVKCKARLMVRGDQEKRDDTRDTYAATLAARSFRIFMAIAAHFNLELKQYDTVNAFVNAILDEEIFMRMAPRYRESGKIYQLNKALYRLRRSPLLWQKELTSTLIELVMNQLRAKYKISGGGDLEWFLGIRVIRDQSNKVIWLSQATYIDKIAKLADTRQTDDTPMA
ncbi:hypothetical protein TSTA_007760 [Talaromyces stipitatus ATCC 10500]|uniref:Reverse transcriptase Ty1/copia-type domain-containing protein n=1 Tax=Talaromyces stipitatus (strain ATCC 10500 / CBS 375.48 / QM 6759 / NRRL 1006) TaxID=441959 RepID=B8MVC6_TALSN|nr:uncharacterized protein TSTA_007760 [Talaromyces stipitatus ATCC 10500]EED11486.1 hypothetical protein TSTA_007760 [Talaromyces stipitatus ATCC 10500]